MIRKPPLVLALNGGSRALEEMRSGTHEPGNKPRETSVWIAVTHHAIQETERWPIVMTKTYWARRR